MARLPARPVDELPADYCMLRSKSFSFLPRKFRALVSLPPMRPKRPPRKQKVKDRQKAPEEPMAVGCYGDFCHVDFKYPQCLQDIETKRDVLTSTGRALCRRHVHMGGKDLGLLLHPEELVACLEEPDEQPVQPFGRFERLYEVLASHVLEARSHPALCGWLEALDWRFDPEDAEAILAAKQRLQADEQEGAAGNMAKRLDVADAGTRYRLRALKVCQSCLNVYKVVHQVITLIRHQRRDRWARAELERRKKQEEKEVEDARAAYIQRVVHCTELRDMPKARAAWLPRQSEIFDPEVTEWMRGIPASPKTAELMRSLWQQDICWEETLEVPPCSPEGPLRRGATAQLF